MMTVLHDYWPLAVVLPALLLLAWALEWLAWRRGYRAGRTETLQALDNARRAGRL